MAGFLAETPLALFYAKYANQRLALPELVTDRSSTQTVVFSLLIVCWLIIYLRQNSNTFLAGVSLSGRVLGKKIVFSFIVNIQEVSERE